MKAEVIINIARSWLGLSRYNQSHRPIIDCYNSYSPKARGYTLTYQDDYCDGFVSAVFIKAGAVDKLGGTEVGVERHVDLFKKKGIWEEDGNVRPQAGWVIVFNWDDATQPNDGWSDHIGIVEAVNGNTITCIEGNMEGGKVGRRYIPIGWGYIRGYAKVNYDDATVNPSPSDDNIVDALYRVRTVAHGWLDAVLNLNDYAGWQNSPITGVAIKVNKGSIKYRAHILGGGWLPWVTGYDLNDFENGYAGNGRVIDAIQVYYYTPSGMKLKEAVYAVNDYDWQHDTDTDHGQDGYAGVYGVPITKLKIAIEDC